MPERGQRGTIVAIGGAEEKDGNPDILRTFVELAGGDDAHIAVIPSAAAEPASTGDEYRRVFFDLGVAEVMLVDPRSRKAASDPQYLEALGRATGIFITGGDQNRLAELIVGTALADCIKERNVAGVVVAGTSAGAAIQASHMVDGGESGSTPFKEMSSVGEGLGLLPNLIVDTHFGERGRTGRLIAMHAAHPEVIAIGLDEDTAAIIDHDLIMRVIGTGAVTVIDGTSIKTDFDQLADKDPIMVNGLELHTVTARYRFDIRARKFVPPLRQCYTAG